ncbi:MAG: DUF4230 domain-containing protein [Prevotella sp.]|jgi:hypothetical protein|nr:DUF4230 domain-containing protein [Prevotella sp.]
MKKRLLREIKDISTYVWVKLVGFALLIAIGGGLLYWFNKDNHIDVGPDQHIDITPTQIAAIKQIGQWEFLSVRDEELVDTLSRGFFSDKELVRIYYGTVRLGIDLQKTDDKWIQVTDTAVVATLPPIQLLDRNFIDEAQTRSFFESGSWSSADREALYNRAYQKMYARCVTPQNIATAEENARQQFAQLLRSLGFEKVWVNIEKSPL